MIFDSRRTRVLEELEQIERERLEQIERELQELEERRQNIETILLRNLLEVIHYFKTVYTRRLRQLGVQQDKIDEEINFCCNPKEFSMLLRFTSILKIKTEMFAFRYYMYITHSIYSNRLRNI